MRQSIATLMVIFLISGFASAQEYLVPSCSTILNNDMTNRIWVEDIDGNGAPNIIFGTGINGNILNYVYKGTDCSQDWSHLDGGWSYRIKGDVKSLKRTTDEDGKPIYIVNSVKSSRSEGDRLTQYVFAINGQGLLQWQFDKECGMTHAVDAADLDKSGIPNVIMGTQSKKVCALKDNIKDKSPLLWSFLAEDQVYYLNTKDIDMDGSIETIAVSKKYLGATVYCLSSTGQLKWSYQISNGFYTAMDVPNLVKVADLDGDGKSEVIVGTNKNGVIVLDHLGKIKWEKSLSTIVSVIEVADIDGDGNAEVIVGSSPDIYLLDSRGGVLWQWKMKVDKTIYSISTYDLDKDGKKEIAVGATRFIYILDDNGREIGGWNYKIEIAGLTKAYEERDADAVAIYMGDLDMDGDAEVVAAWNWEDNKLDINQYSSNLRVYELDKEWAGPPTTTTTTIKAKDAELEGEPMPDPEMDIPTTTVYARPTMPDVIDPDVDEEGSGFCCLPALPVILAFLASVALRIPYAAQVKRS